MLRGTFFNEIDSFAAQWLRELMKAGVITEGEVDERSIEDVAPVELAGRTRCHFFSGIGVWDYALQLAGFPADREVWTGSCPCQPFSAAGKGDGFADERHLWPAWLHLIGQCRPQLLFGEQVASSDATPWIDLVHADLEAIGYTVGSVVTPAAGFGAPQRRHRIYWCAVADPHDGGRSERCRQRRRGKTQKRSQPLHHTPDDCGARGVALGDAASERHEGATHKGDEAHDSRDGSQRHTAHSGAVGGFWADAQWLYCIDDKYRPVEPGTFPLAHGASARVGRLRGYGNAIVATQAAAWVKAFLEVEAERR